MNKTLATVFAGLIATAAFAGKDNVVVSFSTQGPDTYADGTTVVDGESYALVWTPTGSEFAGINADGTAVAPSKVVIKAPVAEGGKCPFVKFEMDEEFAKANYPNGTWGVYLLDTRVFAVDADGVVAKDAFGKDVVASVGGKAVKGYGAVGTVNSEDLFGSVSGGASSVGATSAADVKIKDIKFIGDNVYLYVQGANAGKFDLAAGDDLDSIAAEGKDRSAADDEAIIIRPKKAGGEFFKVIRK